MRARSALIHSGIYLVLTLWARLVFAQTFEPPPATPGPGPSVASEQSTLVQARQHFEAGRRAYDAGDYATAIAEFKSAQQLKPAPVLLYNIGLANERIGKRRVAVGYFRRYLDEQPNAPNRTEVEGRIQSLEAKITPEPPPPPGMGSPPEGTPPPPPERPPLPPPAPAPPPAYYGYVAPAPLPPVRHRSYWWVPLVVVGAVVVTTAIIVTAVLVSDDSHSNAVYYDHARTAPASVAPFDFRLMPNSRPSEPGALFRF